MQKRWNTGDSIFPYARGRRKGQVLWEDEVRMLWEGRLDTRWLTYLYMSVWGWRITQTGNMISTRHSLKQTNGSWWGREGPEAKKHQDSDFHLTSCSQWLPKISRHTHLWKQHCSPRTPPRSKSAMLTLHSVHAFSMVRDNWIRSGHWPNFNLLPSVGCA